MGYQVDPQDDKGWPASGGPKWLVVCDGCGVVRDRSKTDGQECPACGSTAYTPRGEV